MAPPEATRRRCLSRPFAAAAALALAVVVAAAALLAAATTTPTAVLAQSTTTTTTTTTAASPPAFTFGAWLNTGEYPTDVDSPAKWNQRLGFPTAAFQMRMSVPPWPGEPQVLQPSDWDDATDAAVFVTAYADSPAYTWPTDADLTAMAQKLHNISVTTKRQVFLRYLPEMDGPWMNYGAQPDQLVTSWKAMAAILRRTAPEVKIVWSPNFDVANRGGAAFWPGAENVDWVGSSQYWKSSQMGYAGNAPVDDGYVAKEIDFVYNTFAVAYNKPFVISEASYAWEIPLGGGSFADTVGQVEAQRGYWSQVFDTAFLDSHPLFRMAFVFEYIKSIRLHGWSHLLLLYTKLKESLPRSRLGRVRVCVCVCVCVCVRAEDES
ncbi:glycoside hydrolase superfamily [Zopfochytrium polystomum]|nr:glycoside hydrolase superfamily [Zopfochytrium polystomum]